MAFEDARVFYPLLGDFWTRWFGDTEFSQNYAKGLALLCRVVAQVYGAATSRAGWSEIPLTEPLEVWPISFLQSQVNTSPSSLLRFDNNNLSFDGVAEFDDYPPYVAGATDRYVIGGEVYRVPNGRGIVSMTCVADRITDHFKSIMSPGGVWIDGADLVFREDPRTYFSSWQPIYDEYGEETDREITLWARDVEIDRRWLQQLLGYVVGIESRSNQAYKDSLLAALSSTTAGDSAKAVSSLLTAVTGVPFGRGYETVEEAVTTAFTQAIVTDQRVYEIPIDSEPVVVAGEKIAPTQSLCSALTLHSLQPGHIPPGLMSLALPPGYLDGIDGYLVFDDVETEVLVEETEDGPKVSFALGGRPEDVEAFWDEVHRRGVASGALLAGYLDPLRRQPPVAGAVPSTINPLQFLVEHVLRGPVSVCQIRPSLLSADARQRLPWLRELRQMTAPWGGIFLVMTVALRERAEPDNDDPEDGPSGSDSLSAFPTTENPLDETISAEPYTRERLRFWVDTDACVD